MDCFLWVVRTRQQPYCVVRAPWPALLSLCASDPDGAAVALRTDMVLLPSVREFFNRV